VLDWLYENLSEQGLMVYEEWKEYAGWIPQIKLLNDLSLDEANTQFMFQLLENADELDCFDLVYSMPYLEFINHHLRPHNLRLVDLMPFENAYIFCVNDDDERIAGLNECLEAAGMGVNPRKPMSKEQAIAYINEQLQGG
jgi:hypothetical protein